MGHNPFTAWFRQNNKQWTQNRNVRRISALLVKWSSHILTFVVYSAAPAPLSTTASALGSLTIQFTPGPEPNDVDYYEANIGQLKCSVKASVRPPTCTITGLSEGHRHQVNGKACLANGLCSTTASFTAETLPAGMSKYSAAFISTNCTTECIIIVYSSTKQSVCWTDNGIQLYSCH